jgi:hypothetical protein
LEEREAVKTGRQLVNRNFQGKGQAKRAGIIGYLSERIMLLK